ncbi:MAG TPA: helix-turn-helix transcriptional regulator [Candidatus Methylomirabilis sp.]|nr:helix-turn-helix transcriptional regulator [Candidatus Methylomirabilis sp.]
MAEPQAAVYLAGMKTGVPSAKKASPVGQLIKHWRQRRRLSQLSLAVDAEISTRHLSFIETGRARPSRDMVLLLAGVLEVPPRGKNDLLTAAGYAPVYRETALEAPEMTDVRRALQFILRQQEPYPGLVIDGHWNLLMANQGATRLMNLFLSPENVAAIGGRPNAMRLFYHPRGMRPYIVNWEATAAALIQWLHLDLARGIGDDETRRLLDELLAYPDVPQKWRTLDLDAAPAPFLAVELRKGDLDIRFFSTLTSLGVPYDITLRELRVECFFPADAASEATLRRLAEENATS